LNETISKHGTKLVGLWIEIKHKIKNRSSLYSSCEKSIID